MVLLDRHLVLRADETPFHPELSILCDADEGAGPGDLRRIERERTRFEGLQHRLECPEPRVDLFGKLVDIGMFFGQTIVFPLGCLPRSLLRFGQRHGLAPQLA
ncbi:hypothetical protein GGQ86_004858 [Xanthobacter flavus]|uniref:Uncharacterized protein n=1 Tax=Xanthobacter flavus TaxID=281 RepID=A0ABU1KP31_XANFL|nr:hypothetical protein [Xanthobacter flavus]